MHKVKPEENSVEGRNFYIVSRPICSTDTRQALICSEIYLPATGLQQLLNII